MQAAMAEVDPKAQVCTYQDDMEAVCAIEVISAANEAYGAACTRIGLRANLPKTRVTPGRGVAVSNLPVGLAIDHRAIVLRHGGGTPVPALPAASHVEGSLLAEGSPEVQAISESRACFYRRLRELRAAGLRSVAALDMLRARTAGDYVFVARACGIPAREADALDATLCTELSRYFGDGAVIAPDTPAGRKLFLRSTDGGLGFQSIARTSPAAYAASWHACLPKIVTDLGLQGVSGLTAISPWAAQCWPIATQTLRRALEDDSLDIGDDSVAASQHILAKAPMLRPRSESPKNWQSTSGHQRLCAARVVLEQDCGPERPPYQTSSCPIHNFALRSAPGCTWQFRSARGSASIAGKTGLSAMRPWTRMVTMPEFVLQAVGW